ncbi:hypothetical protein FJT64_010661 [Amphibalanus amphitrite]|uniref:Uncharacterized protein n=1 Tax=Amphibalanus amphitrite TaxID=1232801 RepID=A0A6A4V9C8_AMPAM|nr:hypothetical protein FJT64_010661 [Amphibalanus amphitrite]
MSQTGPSLHRVGLAECVAVASACAPTKPLVKKAPETGKVEHLPVVRLLRARHELATAARASQESQTAQQRQLSEQELRLLLRKQNNQGATSLHQHQEHLHSSYSRGFISSKNSNLRSLSQRRSRRDSSCSGRLGCRYRPVSSCLLA